MFGKKACSGNCLSWIYRRANRWLFKWVVWAKFYFRWQDGGKRKNGRSKDSKKKNKKKSKDDVDDEAFEDSDDGDEEGLEVDYMSDKSSDSEEELLASVDVKGVDQVRQFWA